MRHELRVGTADEWLIIRGLAEGNIVSRRLPIFLQDIFSSTELLRLHSTIQAQVEGELRFRLSKGNSVSASRRHTQALKEDILLAAESTKVNRQVLYDLLRTMKTISYNPADKSIHLFFFDRATARQFQHTSVPFRRAVYRLENRHGPSLRSPWDRQQGASSIGSHRTVEYEIHLYKISRFVEISAFISKHSPVTHDLEDMHTCTPESRTSNVWRLTFWLAGCPEFF